jgi:hypothetical protein
MKVIDLSEYKKNRDLKKSTSETHIPLRLNEFYKHKDLPLFVHIIAQSIPSLFGQTQMILAQAHDGKVLCFEYGEEANWEPVSYEVFDKIAQEIFDKVTPDPPEAS